MDLKQSTVGKPNLERVRGADCQRVNHVLVDHYGFQKYPNVNYDQIGTGPANNPKMVDKPRAALAEAKAQAANYKEEG